MLSFPDVHLYKKKFSLSKVRLQEVDYFVQEILFVLVRFTVIKIWEFRITAHLSQLRPMKSELRAILLGNIVTMCSMAENYCQE